MIERPEPLQVGVDLAGVSKAAVAEICEAAHMYPDQVICCCHRVQAKEIAAAILKGAKTPEDISRATGARTGCGVLCIAGALRLLKAAAVELTKAPGYQWNGADVSIWQITPELRQKYPEYYLAEDLKEINDVSKGFPNTFFAQQLPTMVVGAQADLLRGCEQNTRFMDYAVQVEDLPKAVGFARRVARTDKILVFDGAVGGFNVSESLAKEIQRAAPEVSREVDRVLMPMWLKQRGIDRPEKSA